MKRLPLRRHKTPTPERPPQLPFKEAMEGLWHEEIDAQTFLLAYAFGLKNPGLGLVAIGDIESAVEAMNNMLGIARFSYKLTPETVTYKVVSTPNPRIAVVYITPTTPQFRDATASVALNIDDNGWIVDIQASTIYAMKREELA